MYVLEWVRKKQMVPHIYKNISQYEKYTCHPDIPVIAASEAEPRAAQ